MRPDLAVQARAHMSLEAAREHVVAALLALDLGTGKGGEDKAVSDPLIADKGAALDRVARQAVSLGLLPHGLDGAAVAETGHGEEAAPIEGTDERAFHAQAAETRVSCVEAAEENGPEVRWVGGERLIRPCAGLGSETDERGGAKRRMHPAAKTLARYAHNGAQPH